MTPVWKVCECDNCGHIRIGLSKNTYCNMCKIYYHKKKMVVKSWLR